MKAPEPVVVEEKVEEVVQKDLWEGFNALTTDNFQKNVIDDKENVWVVAYISPTCHSCHTLADDWTKLREKSTVTNRNIKFGYVDVSLDSNRGCLDNFCGTNKIKYTPTVLLYGKDKAAPVEYAGDYTLPSLDEKACEFCDAEGFGLGELLKETRSQKKIAEDAIKAAGQEVVESEEDKAKKKAIAHGKDIIIVDDAALQAALVEKKIEKAEEKAAAEVKAAEEKVDDKKDDDKKDDDKKDDDKKEEKLDLDKPIVVKAPEPKEPEAELPTHIASFQKLADSVSAGHYDINDPAAEVELLGLSYGGYGGPGPKAGLGRGYGAGYGKGPIAPKQSYGNSYARPGAPSPKNRYRKGPGPKSSGKLSYGRVGKRGYGAGPNYRREAVAYSGYEVAPVRRAAPARRGPPRRPANSLKNPKNFIRQSPLNRAGPQKVPFGRSPPPARYARPAQPPRRW